MTKFKDYFSSHSPDYLKYRPRYPKEYFRYLSTLVEEHDQAWDCATGNGQAAHGLLPYFRRIIASDASIDQLYQAIPHERITYLLAMAEQVPIEDSSIDLVSVAQALHWFSFEKFYAEVRRVSKPGGIIAASTYGWTTISESIDPIIRQYADEIVGPYWPPERTYVDNEYRTLPFPFKEIDGPRFTMEQQWTVDEFLGYLGTWSSTQRYRKDHGSDPLKLIREELCSAWGAPDATRLVRWPLHTRIGMVG